MKTISFTGGRGLTRTLFVLAALGGLYYFRKRGGTFGQLAEAGTSGFAQARDFINRVAPPVGAISQATNSVASSAQI